MWPFKKRVDKRTVWNDTMIDLYERQIAARQAMGLKWKCHPANAVQRKLFFNGVEVLFDGAPPEIPTVYPPKLRIVK